MSPSLRRFDAALLIEIMHDTIVKSHVERLYNSLLEDNLCKIILPYSEVQIDFIAQQIGLELLVVQAKLSEMILDKKIDGTLD